MDPILEFLREQRREMLETLGRMVELESPSTDKRAVDRAVDYVAEEAETLGARLTRHRSGDYGDHLQADFAPRNSGRGRLLLLGHLDTVWSLGTLSRMPFRIARGRAWGPGVLDMKSGVTGALFALRAVRELKLELPGKVTLLLNSDEEVGSASSRPITERLAKSSDTVLVLEPGTGLHGALKTARKGVGEFQVRACGRAAHAGVDFEKGVSAIVELARQIQRISGFTRLKRGITVNVGVIGGGTRTNVVAEEAWARVDIRIPRLANWGYLEKQFRSLKPFHPQARVEVTGELNRPPMERTRAIVALFRRARELGKPLGLDLQESSTGGGSDGNFTAALGIPTLDGLGGVGEGAHAVNESILLSQFPLRTALLARLILHL